MLPYDNHSRAAEVLRCISQRYLGVNNLDGKVVVLFLISVNLADLVSPIPANALTSSLARADVLKIWSCAFTPLSCIFS
jgi:hypothetical protein